MKSKEEIDEQINKGILEGKEHIKELTSLLMRDTKNGYKGASAVLLTQMMCASERLIALTEVMVDIRDILHQINLNMIKEPPV